MNDNNNNQQQRPKLHINNNKFQKLYDTNNNNKISVIDLTSQNDDTTSVRCNDTTPCSTHSSFLNKDNNQQEQQAKSTSSMWTGISSSFSRSKISTSCSASNKTMIYNPYATAKKQKISTHNDGSYDVNSTSIPTPTSHDNDNTISSNVASMMTNSTSINSSNTHNNSFSDRMSNDKTNYENTSTNTSSNQNLIDLNQNNHSNNNLVKNPYIKSNVVIKNPYLISKNKHINGSNSNGKSSSSDDIHDHSSSNGSSFPKTTVSSVVNSSNHNQVQTVRNNEIMSIDSNSTANTIYNNDMISSKSITARITTSSSSQSHTCHVQQKNNMQPKIEQNYHYQQEQKHQKKQKDLQQTREYANNNPIITKSASMSTTTTSSSSSSSSVGTTATSSTSTSFIPTLPPIPPQLQYDPTRIQQKNDEYKLQLIQNAQLNSTLKNGWKILPHQKQGILRGLLMRRLILAFDMGLGKTLIGCVWAKAFTKTFDQLKVYIIAPVSLKSEWKKTAWNTCELKCKEEASDKKKKKVKTKVDDNFHDDDNEYDIEIVSWAKVPPLAPKSLKHYVVICDEAHNIQSMESSRTKDTLSLVLDKRCKGVLLLTGTPMKNGKPTNLFPLLKASQHPFGDDQRLYETFFCNGQQRLYGGRNVWDASGSSNLPILNAHISSHVFHKTKEDCLKGLPSKTREYRNVPVSSRFQLLHNKALMDLAQTQKSVASMDNDSGTDMILGTFAKLRNIAALAKIDATVALAKNILQVESSVVIFTNFVDVAKQVHKKLHDSGWAGEVLIGETLANKRQEMVDRFQAGISPVFVATFGAGGVGITLTAACTIILLDRPWTPGEALQAEDRVRRIGQTKPVKSIWLQAFKVDEQVDELIDYKSMVSSSAVMSKNKKTVEVNQSQSAPRISIRKLVECILKENESENSVS